MAKTKKRKTTNMKSSTKKKSSARGKTRKKNKKQNERGIRLEISALLVLAGCLLLMLANFGLGGALGGAVSSFFFGLFGLSSYAFPIVLFVGTAFVIANWDSHLLIRKMCGSIAFFAMFCGFLQLLTIGYERGASVIDYYTDSSAGRLGGGILGGILVKWLGFAFGKIGAYIVLVTGMVIAAIVATQRPLLETARRSGTKVLSTAKIQRKKLTETIRIQKEEKAKTKEKQDTKPDENLQSEEEAEETIHERFPDFVITRSEEPIQTYADDTLKEAVYEDHAETAAAQIPEIERERGKSAKSVIEGKSFDIQDMKEEVSVTNNKKKPKYKYPPVSLLKRGKGGKLGDSDSQLKATANKLQETLDSFGVNVTVSNVSCGPTVTRYELQPEHGVKVSKIVNLADDIKLNLAAADIRIEAPIPGKAAVGIEVPNSTNSTVMLRDLLDTPEFRKSSSNLAFAVGKDIAGKPVITDIAKMPHLLIAGATGSGKSVCINTLIMSILYKSSPDDVKLIMIDPKVVELSVYNGIPHLFIPVVTDPKKAAGALNWAVSEMTDRYNKFADYHVRDIKGYNAKVEKAIPVEGQEIPEKLPQIVIIVDELADLMMAAPGEVEDAICRLAQLARAAGLHLIIATQRPSVNVITGLIKANMPSRIAFSVSSGVDSRTILDMNGAEKLLGKGDMLFYPQGYQKPARLQGSFVSDKEVADVVKYLSENSKDISYDEELQQKIEESSPVGTATCESAGNNQDKYFVDAGKFIIEKDKASIGMLQRMFRIGFNRAARIMDQLHGAGVVGPEEGTKPRKILMTLEEFEEYLKQQD